MTATLTPEETHKGCRLKEDQLEKYFSGSVKVPVKVEDGLKEIVTARLLEHLGAACRPVINRELLKRLVTGRRSRGRARVTGRALDEPVVGSRASHNDPRQPPWRLA